MMSPAILWQQLEAQVPGSIALTMRPCLTDPGSAPLFAGLLRGSSAEPARLLLLRVPRYQARVKALPEGTRGLILEPVEYPDDPTVAYVSLRLTEPELGDLFAVLAYDIAGAVAAAAAPESAACLKAFLDRIAGWQELFGRVPVGGLSQLARQGLYGELTLLRRLLTAGIAPYTVVAAWTGPLREPQDFRFGPVAVEVKTTGPTGQVLHISSAAQLDDAPLTILWLYHLALTANTSGETLPAIVAALTATLSADPAAASLFQTRLQLAGYFHAQAGLYEAEGFNLGPDQLARVAGNLPRLRASDLPLALGNLTYTLDVAALVPHRCPFSELLTSLS